MNQRKKIINILKKKDEGIAGIIVAVLLVGLILSVIGIIQTIYVPQWMREKEAEHMSTVLDQFSLLKFAIDTQAATKNPTISLTTSITLGSKEWPVLSSTRAYGFLQINETKTPFYIKDNSGYFQISRYFGLIQYSSKNAYFLDKTYVYEAGALIISQADGNVMAVTPNFYVTVSGSPLMEINITFILINTRGIGEKVSIGGYGTYPIQSRYDSFDPFTFNDISEFSFPTNYKNSWITFFSGKLAKAGLESSVYQVTETSDGIAVKFSGGYDITLHLMIVDIEVQIAPGWIDT